MRMPPFVPSMRIGGPPPFSRPSSRRRDFSVVSRVSPLGVDAAVGDAGRNRGLRVGREPQLDAAVGAFELRAALAQARELDVNTAVGRAGVDRPGDIARGDAAVGRFRR